MRDTPQVCASDNSSAPTVCDTAGVTPTRRRGRKSRCVSTLVLSLRYGGSYDEEVWVDAPYAYEVAGVITAAMLDAEGQWFPPVAEDRRLSGFACGAQPIGPLSMVTVPIACALHTPGVDFMTAIAATFSCGWRSANAAKRSSIDRGGFARVASCPDAAGGFIAGGTWARAFLVRGAKKGPVALGESDGACTSRETDHECRTPCIVRTRRTSCNDRGANGAFGRSTRAAWRASCRWERKRSARRSPMRRAASSQPTQTSAATLRPMRRSSRSSKRRATFARHSR